MYRPDALIEPTPPGAIDHVTAWLTALATVAVNCAVWGLLSITAAGLMLTTMGGTLPLRVMVWTDGDALSVIWIAAV